MAFITWKQFFARTVALLIVIGLWCRSQVTKEMPPEMGNIFVKHTELLVVKPCAIPPKPDYKSFRIFEKTSELQCKNWTYIGKGDGSKGVCLDSEFKLDPNNCNVLSFGINRDWTFDDHFGNFGCKVRSFDPTINKTDHQHAPNVTFYNLGIGKIKGKVKIRKAECEVDTYEGILERLGLKDKVIDYLKMDVEHAEFQFFEDVFTRTPSLLLNIRQIGMETHHVASHYVDKLWKYYHLLSCMGFKIMDSRQYQLRAEIVWGRPDPS